MNRQHSDITIFVEDFEKGNIVYGIAKCHKDDEFNYNTGYALAICRAMRWKKLEEELLESLPKGKCEKQ